MRANRRPERPWRLSRDTEPPWLEFVVMLVLCVAAGGIGVGLTCAAVQEIAMYGVR